MTRLLVTICSVMLSAGSVMLSAGSMTGSSQSPPGQGAFVPVDQLPPADQLPAAPLLIAAYAFVWVAVLFYVWTIWRRLNKVEKDMHALERRSQTR
jgi:CcmD family protein